MEDLPTLGAHHGADRSTQSRYAMQGPFSLAPGVDELSFALYQSTGVELTPGHRAEVIDDGAVFDAIVEDIRRASTSVHILYYRTSIRSRSTGSARARS